MWRKVAATTLVGSGGLYVWGKQGKHQLSGLSDSGLPLVYEVNTIHDYWIQHPQIIAWRLSSIFRSVVPFCGKTAVQHFAGTLDQKENAVELRHLLTDLGPCFIKFGQLLSSRPDLLPETALFELQKLCDAVPSFPTEQAESIVRSELGVDKALSLHLGEVVAAASLGQVYRCKIGDSDKYVAVKVQRPDMLRSVSLDLFLLRKYAKFVEFTKDLLMKAGIVSTRRQFDVALIDCFAAGSYKELDYVNEANNQERFIKDIVSRYPSEVRVPKVYWEYTSRKILTTEWVDGIQLAKAPTHIIQKLVPIGVKVFLDQLLEVGFFHADPHPGNMLVDKQNRLVLIDFGLCCQVPVPDTKTITLAVIHLMEGDLRSLLDDGIALGFLQEDVAKDQLFDELTVIFDTAKENAQKLEIQKPLSGGASQGFAAIQQRKKKFKDISHELNSVFFRFPFLVPDYFALITRALIVLEGIAVTADPAFDIFAAAYPVTVQKSAKFLGMKNNLKILKSAVGQ